MSLLGKEVPFSDIRKEFKLLSSGDESRTHASLMNLAVFTEDAGQLNAIYEQVSELTQNHTCRALSVALDRNASEQGMTSWVSAHCNMTNGKKTVCCEHLSFLLKGFVHGRLRNTVFSQINSDLPLVFWWQGELSDVFEPRLYTLIDRFIFDSAEWADPKAGYERLLTAAEDVQRRFVIQDLAWTTSYPYRLAFASMFDGALAEQEFSKINAGTIKVSEGGKTAGKLALAWLATQAGWSLLSGNSEGYDFKSATGSSIQVRFEVGGTTPISHIGVSSPEVSFRLQTEEATNTIQQVITSNAGEQTLSVGSAMRAGKVALVEDQLSRGGKNTLLRKAIPLFLEILATS